MLHIHIRFSERAKAPITPSINFSRANNFFRSALARRLNWLWLCPLWWAPLALHGQPVVINEIMYHPPTTNVLEQWFELYNNRNAPVDLSGWQVNKGVAFTFPTNTVLAAGGYLAVAADRK